MGQALLLCPHLGPLAHSFKPPPGPGRHWRAKGFGWVLSLAHSGRLSAGLMLHSEQLPSFPAVPLLTCALWASGEEAARASPALVADLSELQRTEETRSDAPPGASLARQARGEGGRRGALTSVYSPSAGHLTPVSNTASFTSPPPHTKQKS